MSLINCEKCNGLKKLLGMGLLEIDCEECNGLGFKKITPAGIIKDEILDDEVHKPKRKGRPKKIDL